MSDSAQYIRTSQLAEKTGLSRRFFEKARLTGDGPPFLKIGGAVVYSWPKVEEWLAKHQRISTSDPGKAA